MTQRSQSFYFLRGIHGIAHQLPQKDLMIGVEKFFDDREYVLGIDGDVSFFLHHGCFS
jgi:hypothetical protein